MVGRREACSCEMCSAEETKYTLTERSHALVGGMLASSVDKQLKLLIYYE